VDRLYRCTEERTRVRTDECNYLENLTIGNLDIKFTTKKSHPITKSI